MRDKGSTRIAGKLTINDWNALCKVLEGTPTKADWQNAYQLFFFQRLETRYLEPIRVLRRTFARSNTGEGFSIVSLQCCLIEFIESTAQGKNYKHGTTFDAATEYNSSEKIFVDFLRNRAPFNNEFGRGLAQKFYSGVRCGLVHEARTKSPWTISSQRKGLNGKIVDAHAKVLYRNNFQDALEQYISQYGKDLPDDAALKKGLIAKFKYLCR